MPAGRRTATAARRAASDPGASEVPPQVHARVQRGDLVRVAVERQRGLPRREQARADAPLGLLAPAGMVDGRVHVRVETVLGGRGPVPGRRRHPLGELDPHDGLAALEAVLPGHDQPQRRAVLVRQDSPVDADREQRERVGGLVDAQRLDVRPVEHGAALAGHLRRIAQRREGDVARARGGLEPAHQVAEREPDPRDDHLIESNEKAYIYIFFKKIIYILF